MVPKALQSARYGVVIFPGSNCERDALHVLSLLDGASVKPLWHKDSAFEDIDVLVLPGGFSYGDYLRCGAIARFSPVMKGIVDFAENGGRVVGICNGFQILVESGLLPGALLPNLSRKYICRNIHVKVEKSMASGLDSHESPGPGTVLKIPIAHHDGNYYADEDTLQRLEDNGQVMLRYCDERGGVTADANPNGSMHNIAGICNERGNVIGLMPHPERCAEPVLGNADGMKLLKILTSCR